MRSCLGGALTIYLLSHLLAVQLSNNCQNLVTNENLDALVIAKDMNQAVMINPNASSLKSSLKESLKMVPALKLMPAVHFFNIMLFVYLPYLTRLFSYNSDIHVHNYNTRNRANLHMVKITSKSGYRSFLPIHLLNYSTILTMPQKAP